MQRYRFNLSIQILLLPAACLPLTVYCQLLPASCLLQPAAQLDSISFTGQVIGWGGLNFSNPGMQQLGGRFLPALYYQHKLRNSIKADIDLAANVYSGLLFNNWTYNTDQSGIKPYRASLRVSSEQWEIRAGLQKISFGSATLLRPLMWFDGIDPRDPLKLTDGVYGLLGRYYFLNNANISVLRASSSFSVMLLSHLSILSLIISDPRFDVIIMMTFLKFTVRPLLSVSLPSSRT